MPGEQICSDASIRPPKASKQKVYTPARVPICGDSSASQGGSSVSSVISMLEQEISDFETEIQKRREAINVLEQLF